MKLFFCLTDVGCFEFLFTTDEQRATELFGIYIVLGNVHPTTLWFTELTPDTVIPSRRRQLEEALSRGIEGFASFDDGVNWVIRPVQQAFDELSAEAAEESAL